MTTKANAEAPEPTRYEKAAEIWLSMTLSQRIAVTKNFSHPKGLSAYYRKVIKYIADNLEYYQAQIDK